MTERLPMLPDPATAPEGSTLLVRTNDGSVVIAVRFAQHNRAVWVAGDDLQVLHPARVADAMLLDPARPFGSVSWDELNQVERDQLFWGALQALAARPHFQREVADAWVRLAFDRDDKAGRPSLVNRLRRDSLDKAKEIVRERLVESITIDGIDVNKLLRETMSAKWNPLADRVMQLVKARVDENIRAVVAEIFDARLNETFEYLRRGVGLAVNAAIGRLGQPPGAKPSG